MIEAPGLPRERRLAALDAAVPLLACPVCQAALNRDGASLACLGGHRFDIARGGQVNLLGRAAPANADTAAMVAARQAFLGTGSYRPILEAIIEVATSHDTAPECPMAVVEFGAGPGYYLSGLLAALPPEVIGLATDVSPAAARAAAAAGLASVVADSWARLPLQEACVDMALCVFAPRQPVEFGRVLAPGGRIILVTPRPDHLIEARQSLGLLGVHPRAGEQARAAFGRAGFAAGPVRSLTYPLACDIETLARLIAMGPNAHHEHASPTAGMTLTVAVEVSLLRRST